MRETRRTAQAVLKSFSSRKGAELVQSMAAEIGALHQLVDDLRLALEQVQAQQDLTAHMFSFDLNAGQVTALPTELDILPECLQDAQAGLYSLEHTADSVPFRWTGPEKSFSFSVCISRTEPVTVRLEALALIDVRRQGNLCLHVDGTVLPFPLTWNGTRYVGEAVLSTAPLRTVTTLTFALPVTLNVPDSTTDLRELGLGFSKLTLRPLTILVPENNSDPAQAAQEELAAGTAPGDFSAVAGGDAPGDCIGVSAKAISLSADQITDGYPGLLELETEPGGIPFRWSDGKGSVSFSVHIDRSGFVAMTLKLAAVVDPLRQSPIDIVVDGETHSVPITETSVGLLEARLTLPPVVGRKTMALKFEVSPFARKGKGTRKYGVAFQELILQPVPEALTAANAPVAPPKSKRPRKTARRSTLRSVRETVTATGI